MAFLSQITGRPVTDVDGKLVGTLKDLVARLFSDLRHPIIEAIVIQRKEDEITAPYSAVAALLAPSIPLHCRAEEIPTYTSDEKDICLVQEVLDKQIIDTNGARVVRVNDLELVRVNGTIVVSNVDVGGLGILRRIGMDKLALSLVDRLKIHAPQSYISWDDVELLRHDQSMVLRIPGEKIAELHPADIAEIISDLNRLESGEFLESLDMEHLADTLEEVEPDFQASLVEGMPDERVADLLEEMAPDEAADLLAELPRERSEDLLKLMEKEDADDVRRLLTYPEESAGGLMTTEYAAVSPNLTAALAIQALRESVDEAETIFYVYVTEEDGRLAGVFSLSKLIFEPPDHLVADFMQKRVVSVHLLDEQDEIARVIAKYDLLAVPVVDDDNRLQGIVTSDDALDKIIPTAWKKRLPRFYR